MNDESDEDEYIYCYLVSSEIKVRVKERLTYKLGASLRSILNKVIFLGVSDIRIL